MNDAEAEAIAHQLAPETFAPAFNPANVVSGLNPFVSSVLGSTAVPASSNPTSFAPDSLTIQLALAKRLEDIHAAILSVKAKTDHAQQIASSALSVASAAAATPPEHMPKQLPLPRSRCRGTAAELRCPSSQGQSPSPPATAAAAGTPTSTQSKKPASATTPLPAPATTPAYSPAQRRLLAPLRSPQKTPNGPTLLQTLPVLLANLLLEKKLAREAAIFMASINDNGTVSITAPQGYAAG